MPIADRTSIPANRRTVSLRDEVSTTSSYVRHDAEPGCRTGTTRGTIAVQRASKFIDEHIKATLRVAGAEAELGVVVR